MCAIQPSPISAALFGTKVDSNGPRWAFHLDVLLLQWVPYLCCRGVDRAVLAGGRHGAGFATVPAYLRDLFGAYQVGAIHGRLLTAWSTAGRLGPVIVNAIADNRIAAGVTGPAATPPPPRS